MLTMAGSLGSTSMSFLIGPVTDDLDLPRSAFAITATVSLLVGVLFMPLVGRLIPRVGVRWILIVGGVLASTGVALFAASGSLVTFYLAALVMGVGYGSTITLIPAILVNAWFESRRGLVFGIVLSATGVAATVMSLILPTFTAHFGWRAGYLLIASVMAVFMLVPATMLIVNKPSDVGLEPYRRLTPPRRRQPAAATSSTGMSYRQALASPEFYALFLAFALMGTSNGLITHLPVYFADLGFDAAVIGYLMATLSLTLIIAKPTMGWLNDRLGTGPVFALFAGAHAAALTMLLVSDDLRWLVVTLVLAAFGFGEGNFFPPIVAGQTLGLRNFGQIWGTLAMAYAGAFAIAAPLWGLVFDTFGSYRPGIATAPFVILLYTVIIVMALRTGRRKVAKLPLAPPTPPLP